MAYSIFTGAYLKKGAKPPPTYGVLPTCQNSQERQSPRAEASVGMKRPNFSARWSRMAPDSKMCTGLSPEESISAGILELGLTSTNPDPNGSPFLISISQASYSAPERPASRSSSSSIVTFIPFQVPWLYSCSGCLPFGSSRSNVAPAVGRLMESKTPPFGLRCVHTLGGT